MRMGMRKRWLERAGSNVERRRRGVRVCGRAKAAVGRAGACGWAETNNSLSLAFGSGLADHRPAPPCPALSVSLPLSLPLLSFSSSSSCGSINLGRGPCRMLEQRAPQKRLERVRPGRPTLADWTLTLPSRFEKLAQSTASSYAAAHTLIRSSSWTVSIAKVKMYRCRCLCMQRPSSLRQCLGLRQHGPP